MHKIITLSLISLVSLFLSAYSGSGDYAFMSIKFRFLFSYFLYFTVSVLVAHFYKEKIKLSVIILIIALPPLIVYGTLHIINFEITRVSIPYTLSIFLGVFIAWVYLNRMSLVLKSLFIISFKVLVIWFYFSGYEQYIHKLDYGSFNGVVNKRIPKELPLGIDTSLNLKKVKDYSGKYLVIDSWHTRCGACFKGFPKFQELHLTFDKAQFIALNRPFKNEKYTEIFNLIKKEYSFDVLIATNNEEANQVLEIGNAFPTTLIISPKSQLVYKGSLSGAKQKLDKIFN